MRKRKVNEHVKLNDKQRLFCEEYIKDKNAVQAAIRAGYSERSIAVQSVNLMRNELIKERISELQDRVSVRNDVTVDKIIRELSRLAFTDISQLFDDEGKLKDIKNLPDDLKRAISSIEVIENKQNKDIYVKKIRLWDKVKAIEMLAKHLDIFRDKEQSTQINVYIDKYINDAEQIAIKNDIYLSNDNSTNVSTE